MENRLKYLPQLALDKSSETESFFNKIKKKTPKNLDYIVLKANEKDFEKTDCLSCANCCKTTGPIFLKSDVKRISKLLKIKSSDFEEKYLKEDEDDDFILKNLPCHFLAIDNKCMIYDFRPKACREYPHTNRKKIHKIASITIKNTAICPAAYDIVEKIKNSIKVTYG